MKLDIACGQNKQQGFKGIDVAGEADIIHDLNDVPWPVKTNSVTEVFCSHYVEHIPHWRPNFTKDGWFHFFDEVYRVCKHEAVCNFVHPYSRNDRAFWDPTHVRFVNETTWYYLDKNWRESQGLDHYPTEVDFEVVVINAAVEDAILQRNAEMQEFARKHYFNALGDLSVQLKVRKPRKRK